MVDFEKRQMRTADAGRPWNRFGVGLTFPSQAAANQHIDSVRGSYPNVEFQSVQRGGVWVIEYR